MRTALSNPVSHPNPDLFRKVAVDRVRLLYDHARGALLATAVASLLLVLAVSKAQPNRAQLLWLLGIYVVLAMRALDVVAQRHAKKKSREQPRYWLARFAAGVVITALTWDVFAVCFLPHFDAARISMVAVTFAALAGGGVAFLSAQRWLGVTYGVLLLVPGSAMLMIMGGLNNMVLGALGCVFAATISTLVASAHRSVVHALYLAHENEQLLVEAEGRGLETEQLNAELLSARQQLIDANHSLEDRILRRTEQLEREIAERKAYQHELEQLANLDPLTQLGNRSYLMRMVEQAIGRVDESGQRLAICFIDLDRFKQVNDGLGHAAGDRVLQFIAQRLELFAGEGLVVARWGGDEFIVMQPRVSDLDAISSLGEELVAVLNQPIELEQGSVLIGASVGVAIFPEDGETPEKLIENADLAVYQAKKDGRGITRIYQQEWGVRAREKLIMAQSLRDAILQNRLHLHFQPIVDITLSKVIGMEALCRWSDPIHGTIGPSDFIPVAEESGIISPLGKWVLQRACESIQTHLPGADDLSLAVNVSVLQLLDKEFLQTLDAILAKTGFMPQRLKIEITESLFAENTDQVLNVLQALRRRGIRISIDDFGSGYSSMGYLRKFPIDILKVDGSFVRDLDQGGESIIAAVLSMGRSLGLDVIVEGVETASQFERITALGAEKLQGFFISPGLPDKEAFRDFSGFWTPRRAEVPEARQSTVG